MSLLGDRKRNGVRRDAEAIEDAVFEHKFETDQQLREYDVKIRGLKCEIERAFLSGETTRMTRLLKQKKSAMQEVGRIQAQQELMADTQMRTAALQSNEHLMRGLNAADRLYRNAAKHVNPQRAAELNRNIHMNRTKANDALRVISDGQQDMLEDFLDDDLEDDGEGDEELVEQYMAERAMAAAGSGDGGPSGSSGGALTSAVPSATASRLLDRLAQMSAQKDAAPAAAAPQALPE